MQSSHKRMVRTLLIDVSNSFTKLAIARNRKIGRVHTIPTASINASKIRAFRVDRAVISSVVPKVNQILAKALNCSPIWVDYRVAGGVSLRYPNPSSIGADRLANAAAAVSLGKLPSIVVDFGTAVTFDVIDSEGRYIGGIIAPGLPTAASALHERTALLPMTQIGKITSSIGKNTREAIRIGLLLGAAGLVREAVTRITKEQFKGIRPTVIATGGDSELVTRLTARHGDKPLIDLVDPLFTLRGLLVIAEKNP